MTGEESELYAPFLMMISNIKVLDDKLSIEYISQPLMWNVRFKYVLRGFPLNSSHTRENWNLLYVIRTTEIAWTHGNYSPSNQSYGLI